MNIKHIAISEAALSACMSIFQRQWNRYMLYSSIDSIPNKVDSDYRTGLNRQPSGNKKGQPLLYKVGQLPAIKNLRLTILYQFHRTKVLTVEGIVNGVM